LIMEIKVFYRFSKVCSSMRRIQFTTDLQLFEIIKCYIGPIHFVDKRYQVSGMILLLTENIEIAEMIRKDLGEEGFQVELADQYPDALLRLARNPKYQFLILDFNLRTQNAFDICKKVKQNPRLQFLPIVALINKERLVDQLMAFEEGADDFILTPYSTVEIQLKLRSLKRMIELREKMRLQETELENLQNIQRIMVTLNHYINNALTPLSFAVQFFEQMPNDDNAVRLKNISKDTVFFVSRVLRSLQSLIDSGKTKVARDGVYKDIMFDIEKELNELIAKNKQ